jgi:hypothetical protein
MTIAPLDEVATRADDTADEAEISGEQSKRQTVLRRAQHTASGPRRFLRGPFFCHLGTVLGTPRNCVVDGFGVPNPSPWPQHFVGPEPQIVADRTDAAFRLIIGQLVPAESVFGTPSRTG